MVDKNNTEQNIGSDGKGGEHRTQSVVISKNGGSPKNAKPERGIFTSMKSKMEQNMVNCFLSFMHIT